MHNGQECPVRAPEVLGGQPRPHSPQPPTGETGGVGEVRGQRRSWGQRAAPRRQRKPPDCSHKGMQKLRPRHMSTPLCVWFCLGCCERENCYLRLVSHQGSLFLISEPALCSWSSPTPVFCICGTKLHVAGLSQSLASCSSSHTSSTPSLRKGEKFSKCFFFGCSEISFLCHLLVISVSWLLRT